jgi:REP element-mobilizing transposase RayT
MKPQKGSRNLRKGRASIKNQHYLVTTAVEGRLPVFSDPETAEIVMSSLLWLEKQSRIILDAAVVMPDHLHFVASLQSGSLSQLLHSLKGHTAYQINKLHKKKGPFWQPQYHDHAVRHDEDLFEVVHYTLRNPVRAGIIDDFHDYPFWYCRWEV